MGEPQERRLLIRSEIYDDGTGELTVDPSVSDNQAAEFLLHVAGVVERGEHRQEHGEAPSGG